jgi:hypothetical protein
MNFPCKTGLILALTFAFSLPINASADEITIPAAITEQPAAQPMSSMQDMMREMRRDRDPSKCKTMQGAAANADAPTPMPGMGMGMGMGMMGMGPGKGGMHGENCKTGGGMQGQDKPCMQGQHMNCHMRGGVDDKRLDMLEKRMDMMQMMIEMMLRSGSNN